MLVLAVWLRAQRFEFESSDYHYILTTWIEAIRERGLLHVYGTSFSNYTPFYPYMLGLFDAAFAGLNGLVVVKCVSFIGEAFALFWVWRIMALGSRAGIAVAAVLLCPSMVTNGAITGQCDAWLLGFVLVGVYYWLKGQGDAVLLMLGLAFAFKPQAVFFSPLLLLLIKRGEVKWQQLWLVPAAYFIVCVPAWLEGRSALDLFYIYPSQTKMGLVSYFAANPYMFLNRYMPDEVKVIGAVLAALVGIGLSVWCVKSWKTALDVECALVTVLLFASVMPFVLPLMHDRYFFMADVVAVMLACLKVRWILVAVLLQGSSFIASPPQQMPRFEGVIGFVQALGMNMAIGMNVAAIGFTLWWCGREFALRGREIPLSIDA